MAPTRLILSYTAPDAPHARGAWAIHRHGSDGTDPVQLAVTHAIPRAAVTHAHWWAIDEMRRYSTRVVSWGAHTDPAVYVAVTAPLRAWDVTAGVDRSGHTWHRRADHWTRVGDGGYRSLAQMDACGGFAQVTAVSSLTALVDEVLVYRATAGYMAGGEDCFGRECDGYADEDGDDDPAIRYCHHIEHHIATAVEVYALARVHRELGRLAREHAAPSDDQAGCGGPAERAERRAVLQAVATIRAAIERTDEDG